MKKSAYLTAILLTLCLHFHGQDKIDRSYRNFPIVVSMQFHSLSLPFRHLRSNFSNVGLGLGTEVSHNGAENWVQQFNVIWYRNKNIGNGLLLNTQTVWRPTIAGDMYSEIKAGVGYNYCFRPVESFRPGKAGWLPAGRKGKGMLTILGGVSAGLDKYSSATYVSPFASYEFLLLKGYSKSIPIVPETLFQVGSRIHL
ncbi:MAG TPA: hypothetical protein VFP87_09705 [Chitinophagaceae bacterium]|nr:hypothetical protein [Chitinophagaceae bacterium]